MRHTSIGLLTATVRCSSPPHAAAAAGRWASDRREALIPYITKRRRNHGQQLGMRVNRIYTWLPGKGGKIYKRTGRAASPAARPAPLLGWVGGKAWLSAGCTIESVAVSPRKQTT